MMSEREQFIALVDNDILKPSDAIILLEGDGVSRVATCVQLLRSGLAPRIVVSGALDAPARGCIPAASMRDILLAAGVEAGEMILEDRSLNTRDQALEVMKLAQVDRWKRIILVASNYHQYRAYLTFLKARQEFDLELEILNAPARDLPWFEDLGWGCRIDLLESELQKIDSYAILGHLATFKDGLAHQRWKEGRP